MDNKEFLEQILGYVNALIKTTVVEISTNINPDNDVPKYTYNTLQRMRIADLRSLKKLILDGLKDHVYKAQKSGYSKEQIDNLGKMIDTVLKDSVDVLGGV